MKLFHQKQPAVTWDPATQEPCVRRSICTGEMTVGFLDKATGQFRDLMRVDGRKGLEAFCRQAGIDPDTVKTIY